MRRCCGALQFCSKTKCTLINTRTQATLALGARWNGWGAFLSSSERNTLGEGVFPVIHSRNALLLLIKAQPFQRPRQQPQQLQLAAAATSSSCHNKATNPPQQHEHTCCCKNFGSMEIGSGMGCGVHSWSHWPGRSLCHRLCGYPAWSRECKSTSGSSGAEAGSRTVTGDGSSVGGSGEGLPLVRGKPSLPTGGPTPARLRTRVGPSMVVLPSWPQGRRVGQRLVPMSASARPHRSRPRRLYSYILRVPRT